MSRCLVAAALLLPAACGSGGGSFCDAASEMERWDPTRVGLGEAVEKALEGYAELAGEAPPDVAEDIDTVSRGLERLAADGVRQGREYAEASSRVRAAVEEECS